MAFELRDHTADIAVAATGDTLAAVFASAANGLAAATCDEIPSMNGSAAGGDGPHDAAIGNAGSDRFSLSVTARFREALLYDYLADLIYERDVRALLPVDNRVTIHEPDRGVDPDDLEDQRTDGESGTELWRLDASARGIPLSAIDAREVKAVTYSEMAIGETTEGWRAYVLFDV